VPPRDSHPTRREIVNGRYAFQLGLTGIPSLITARRRAPLTGRGRLQEAVSAACLSGPLGASMAACKT
jgi:hypothetical protein